MASEKEKFLAGKPFIAGKDPELNELIRHTQMAVAEYNRPEMMADEKQSAEIIRKILGKTGKHFRITRPFHVDYGINLEIGENFFSNYNLTVLDSGKVKIGDDVRIGPNVGLYSVNHPVDPEERKTDMEYGLPITIGNNVWLGGHVVVCPGVTIGDNAVVGAGSVVVKDIPANTVAVGNPARVVKHIGKKH